jgi:hypothetical protein
VLPSQKRCRVLDFGFWASPELFMFFCGRLATFFYLCLKCVIRFLSVNYICKYYD